MKTASLLAVILVTFITLHVESQQAESAAAQNTMANASGISANPSGIAGAGGDIGRRGAPSRTRELRAFYVQLMGNLDSKSAKLGDPVELRTLAKTKIEDGTEIPKGTKIMGHLTSVVPHGKGRENAQVTVQLDRAVLKGGGSLAIRAEIQRVTPPPSTSTADVLRSQNNIGGGVMGDATQVMGGEKGGGLGNGGSGGLSTSNGKIVRTDSLTERPGSVTNYGMQAPQGSGQPSAGTDTHSDGSAIVTGTERGHATGVPGVMLASDASGANSGTFSAVKQNVHLDGGTLMVLGVAVVQ